MDLKLHNKYALVSGGSHGIGRSIALLLAENGCNVCIFSRDKDRVDSVVKEILLRCFAFQVCVLTGKVVFIITTEINNTFWCHLDNTCC